MKLSRSLALQLKDFDPTGRTVQFYGSAFGNEDSDGDILMPRAFLKSIQENGPGSVQPRIKHLLQHSPYSIIGKFTELVEDSKGLLCTSQIADTQEGNDVLALYALDLYEHSIGYNTVKSEIDNTDPENPVRRLLEVKLWEVSSVTWGANADTPLVGIKSQQAGFERVADRKAKLTHALRHGHISDNLGAKLADELDALETAYKGLISLPGASKPAESRPLILDLAESKADEPDVPKAKKWLGKAIALHEKHMDGTAPTTGDAGEASQKLMMTQMKTAMTALGGDMGAMKATSLVVEPSGIVEALKSSFSFLNA